MLPKQQNGDATLARWSRCLGSSTYSTPPATGAGAYEVSYPSC